jgi:DnaJ-class molecular chaperone
MPVLIRIDSRAIREIVDLARLIFEISNSGTPFSQRRPGNLELSRVYNPFEVLGLSPQATDEKIKSRYRQLSKIWHPDMQGGDEEAMKRLNAAYEEICDQRHIRP